MNRNKRTWKVLEDGKGETIYVGAPPIALPKTMTVSVEGFDRPLLLDFAWSTPAWAMVLVGMRGGVDSRGDPLGLPPSLSRAVAPGQLVAEALRSVGRQMRWPAEMRCSADLEDVGPLARGDAAALARGRSKAQESVRMMRKRAAVLAERLLADGVTGRELYQRVADELGVGRTTAYTYLRDSGVIGKGKRR